MLPKTYQTAQGERVVVVQSSQGMAIALGLMVLSGIAGHRIAKARRSSTLGTVGWTVGSALLPGVVAPIGVLMTLKG